MKNRSTILAAVVLLASGLAGCTTYSLSNTSPKTLSRMELYVWAHTLDLARAEAFVQDFPGAVLQIHQVKLIGPDGDMKIPVLGSITVPLNEAGSLLTIKQLADEFHEPVIVRINAETAEILPEDQEPIVSFYPLLFI